MADYKKERIEIACPYYCKIGNWYIECEGINGSNVISAKFDTYGKREKYRTEYCNQYPNECPIAKMLDTKYQ